MLFNLAPLFRQLFISFSCLPVVIAHLCTAPLGTQMIKHYYVSGALCQQYPCRNGVPDGMVKEFFEDGTPASKCFFSAGKREGPCMIYYRGGKTARVIYFKDNQKKWMRQYYQTGIIQEETWYRNSGTARQKLYDASGKLKVDRDIPNAS